MTSTEVVEENGALESAASDEVAIQITDMNKWFGDFHVLRDINLTVNGRWESWLRTIETTLPL